MLRLAGVVVLGLLAATGAWTQDAGATPRRYLVDLAAETYPVDTAQFFGVAHWPVTDQDKALFLPRLRHYGIRLIRGDLSLEALIPEPLCPDLATFERRAGEPGFVDSWDWTRTRWAAEAKAEGFGTLGLFAYMPRFVTANGSLPRRGDRAAWEAWGRVCGEVYRRVGADLDYLEVFNEAHFFTNAEGTGYGRSVEADPDIFHYAEPHLRPRDDKPIMGPATWIDCWAGSGLETLPFDTRSAPGTLDYFSIHVYDTDPQAFLDRIRHTREVLDGTREGLPEGYAAPWAGKPIWLTEWNQYWQGDRYGMDWYGFILTELLRQGIPNVIYNYREFFGPEVASACRPWRLLVECGLNAAPQVVRVHPQTALQPADALAGSVSATLPDGTLVILAANRTAAPCEMQWQLSGLAPADVAGARLRLWEASGAGDELARTGDELPGSLELADGLCSLRHMLPGHSFSALCLTTTRDSIRAAGSPR